MRTKRIKTTETDERLIKELTAKPVFAQLDAGEIELVPDPDWLQPVDVPEPSVHLPSPLYDKLVKKSRQKKTTPEKLVVKLVTEGLRLL